MPRSRSRDPYPYEVRYFAGARLGLDNWSRKSYALTVDNARQRIVMKLVIEFWQKAVIMDRYTGRVLLRYVRTSYGIHEVTG
jgi:hypothetical protein